MVDSCLHISSFAWAQNVGPHFETWNAGVLGPVSLSGLNEGRRDLTWQKWSYTVSSRTSMTVPLPAFMFVNSTSFWTGRSKRRVSESSFTQWKLFCRMGWRILRHWEATTDMVQGMCFNQQYNAATQTERVRLIIWGFIRCASQMCKDNSFPIIFSLVSQTTFNAPDGDEPLALDMNTMSKGQVWINGQSIGRYWNQYKASSGCTPCNYTGWFNEKKCLRNCGEASQRW